MSFTEYIYYFHEAARGIQEYTEIMNGKPYHPGIASKKLHHHYFFITLINYDNLFGASIYLRPISVK